MAYWGPAPPHNVPGGPGSGHWPGPPFPYIDPYERTNFPSGTTRTRQTRESELNKIRDANGARLCFRVDLQNVAAPGDFALKPLRRGTWPLDRVQSDGSQLFARTIRAATALNNEQGETVELLYTGGPPSDEPELQSPAFNWLHLQSPSLNLERFEDAITSRRELPRDALLLIVNMFSHLRNTRSRSSPGSGIEDGTVVSFEGSQPSAQSKGTPSTVFINVPMFTACPQKDMEHARLDGQYHIRSLMQKLYPLEVTTQMDREHILSNHYPGCSGQALGVSQVWIVVVGTEYVMTCSSLSIEELAGPQVTLKRYQDLPKSGNTLIHLMCEGYKPMYLAANSCRSYFELRQKVSDEIFEQGGPRPDIFTIWLCGPEKVELTPDLWLDCNKSSFDPVVTLEIILAEDLEASTTAEIGASISHHHHSHHHRGRARSTQPQVTIIDEMNRYRRRNSVEPYHEQFTNARYDSDEESALRRRAAFIAPEAEQPEYHQEPRIVYVAEPDQSTAHLATEATLSRDPDNMNVDGLTAKAGESAKAGSIDEGQYCVHTEHRKKGFDAVDEVEKVVMTARDDNAEDTAGNINDSIDVSHPPDGIISGGEIAAEAIGILGEKSHSDMPAENAQKDKYTLSAPLYGVSSARSTGSAPEPRSQSDRGSQRKPEQPGTTSVKEVPAFLAWAVTTNNIQPVNETSEGIVRREIASLQGTLDIQLSELNGEFWLDWISDFDFREVKPASIRSRDLKEVQVMMDELDVETTRLLQECQTQHTENTQEVTMLCGLQIRCISTTFAILAHFFPPSYPHEVIRLCWGLLFDIVLAFRANISRTPLHRVQKFQRLATLLQSCSDHLQAIQGRLDGIKSGVATRDSSKPGQHMLPQSLFRAFDEILRYLLLARHSFCIEVKIMPLMLEILDGIADRVGADLISAQRDLITLTGTNADSPSVSIKPIRVGYLVSVILSNIINHRTLLRNDSIAAVYRQILLSMQYQLVKRPRRKLFLENMLLQEEFVAVQKIMADQSRCLISLICLSMPVPRGIQDLLSLRRSHMELDGLLSALEAHKSLQDEIASLLTRSSSFSRTAQQAITIVEEDHGKAILAFTIITIIFLPLSFVSSYLGMNTSDVRNLRQNQALFWQIAIPLTSIIISIVVLVVYKSDQIGQTKQQVLDWLLPRSDEAVSPYTSGHTANSIPPRRRSRVCQSKGSGPEITRSQPLHVEPPSERQWPTASPIQIFDSYNQKDRMAEYGFTEQQRVLLCANTFAHANPFLTWDQADSYGAKKATSSYQALGHAPPSKLAATQSLVHNPFAPVFERRRGPKSSGTTYKHERLLSPDANSFYGRRRPRSRRPSPEKPAQGIFIYDSDDSRFRPSRRARERRYAEPDLSRKEAGRKTVHRNKTVKFSPATVEDHDDSADDGPWRRNETRSDQRQSPAGEGRSPSFDPPIAGRRPSSPARQPVTERINPPSVERSPSRRLRQTSPPIRRNRRQPSSSSDGGTNSSGGSSGETGYQELSFQDL